MKTEKIKQKTIELIKIYKSINKSFNTLSEIFPDVTGPLFDDAFKLIDICIKELDPSNSGWLEWYIYENDCGKKEFEAGYDNNMKPIKNIDDLFEIINDSVKRSEVK